MSYIPPKNEADEFYNSLVLDIPNNRLDEAKFKDYFLPVLAGKETHNDEVIAQWMHVAGSPTSEVDIVNNNNEVLFTVPSLLNTSRIKVTDHNTNLAEVLVNYELLSRNIPAIAENKLKKDLMLTSNSIIDQNNTEDKDRWSDILVRYGYLNKQNNNKIDEDGDDLVYD